MSPTGWTRNEGFTEASSNGRFARRREVDEGSSEVEFWTDTNTQVAKETKETWEEREDEIHLFVKSRIRKSDSTEE